MSGNSSRSPFDHVVLMTGDLSGAATAFEALGFTVSPRGGHPQFGTANHVIVFADHYLELLGIDAPTSENAGYRARIRAGRGLDGLALATTDIEHAAQRARMSGNEVGDIKSFSRPIETGEGVEPALFRTVTIEPWPSMDAMVFYCEHRTPHLVWTTESMQHPNGCGGITTAEFPAHSPEAAGLALGRLIDQATNTGRVRTTIRSGGRSLALVARSDPSLVLAVGSLPSRDAVISSGFAANLRRGRMELRHPALGNTTIDLVLDERASPARDSGGSTKLSKE